MKIPQPKEKRKPQTRNRTPVDRRMSQRARFRFRHSASNPYRWHDIYGHTGYSYSMALKPCRNCGRGGADGPIYFEDKRWRCFSCKTWNDLTEYQKARIKYGFLKSQFPTETHLHRNMFYVPGKVIAQDPDPYYEIMKNAEENRKFVLKAMEKPKYKPNPKMYKRNKNIEE